MTRVSGIVFLAAAAALGGCGGGEAEQADSPERVPDAQERAMLDDAASMLDEGTVSAKPPPTPVPEGSAR